MTRINYNDSRKLAISASFNFCLNARSGNNDRLDVWDSEASDIPANEFTGRSLKKISCYACPLITAPISRFTLKGISRCRSFNPGKSDAQLSKDPILRRSPLHRLFVIKLSRLLTASLDPPRWNLYDPNEIKATIRRSSLSAF